MQSVCICNWSKRNRRRNNKLSTWQAHEKYEFDIQIYKSQLIKNAVLHILKKTNWKIIKSRSHHQSENIFQMEFSFNFETKTAMDTRLCYSNGRKKPVNAINIKHTKRELYVNISVCTVFFFKDASASLNWTINPFLNQFNLWSFW